MKKAALGALGFAGLLIIGCGASQADGPATGSETLYLQTAVTLNPDGTSVVKKLWLTATQQQENMQRRAALQEALAKGEVIHTVTEDDNCSTSNWDIDLFNDTTCTGSVGSSELCFNGSGVADLAGYAWCSGIPPYITCVDVYGTTHSPVGNNIQGYLNDYNFYGCFNNSGTSHTTGTYTDFQDSTSCIKPGTTLSGLRYMWLDTGCE